MRTASDSKIRSQIEQLRTEYLRNKAEAKAKAEAELGQKPKTKTRNKPKSKSVPKKGPNPLILVMNDKVDFDKTRMMRNATINELFAKHDMHLNAEWKRLNKIDLTDDDNFLNMNPIVNVNMDNMDMDSRLNNLVKHDIDRLKLKFDIDLEIGSQHRPDTYRDRVSWPHECDKLDMNNDEDIVNMDMKPLSDSDNMNIVMNRLHDTGLKLIPESPPFQIAPPT